MRLTKYDKEAFVRAVMGDVPTIDYGEQMRSKMIAWGISTLPKEVAELHKKYPGYIKTKYMYTPAYCVSVHVVCHVDIQEHSSAWKEKYPEVWDELVLIGELSKEQARSRNALEEKVTGLISSCSTLKAAKERLPEFEKYLPVDRDGTGVANLPAANVIADLTNAGWPKGEPLKAEPCPA